MKEIEIEPWEPEETVGKIWHRFASRLDVPEVHEGARVGLAEVGGRLAVLFRGLGGDPSVEIKPVMEETSQHRLAFLRGLGTEAEAVPRASFDGAALRLPESLAVFPAREANAALYLWLAAAAAVAQAPDAMPEDPASGRSDGARHSPGDGRAGVGQRARLCRALPRSLRCGSGAEAAPGAAAR